MKMANGNASKTLNRENDDNDDEAAVSVRLLRNDSVTLQGLHCCRMLLNGPFFFCIFKRLFGIFMMIFDISTDIKLTVDLASRDINVILGPELVSPPPPPPPWWNVSSNATELPPPPVDPITRPTTVFNPLGIMHPVWFGLTLTFLYLPHFGSVWSNSVKNLLTKFVFHRFHAINKLEKGDAAYLQKHLPRFAYFLIFMDENKTRFLDCTCKGKIILVFYWIFNYIFKGIFFALMPALVVFRQMRNVTIVYRLEQINILLGLSPNKTALFELKRLDVANTEPAEVDDFTARRESIENDESFPGMEKWKRILFGATTANNDNQSMTEINQPRVENDEENRSGSDPDWDKLYASEQSRLLDSLMTLSEERNHETFFESAPQATLQIYMMLVSVEQVASQVTWTPWRIFSIGSSIIALGLAASDYTEHKLRRHFTREEPKLCGTICILLWKVPTLAARCVALAVFCACLRTKDTTVLALLAVVFVHFAISFVVEYHYLDDDFKKEFQRKYWRDWIQCRWRLWVRLWERAWISFFTWLEFRTKKYDYALSIWVDHDDPREKKLPSSHLRNLLIYYIAICIENAAFLIPWIHLTMQDDSNDDDDEIFPAPPLPAYVNLVRLIILMLVLFASPLSIMFMMGFHIVCHVESELLKVAKRYMFQKSENYYERQFELLHDAIVKVNLQEFEDHLDGISQDDRRKVALVKSSKTGLTLAVNWLKNKAPPDKILDEFEIGKLLVQILSHDDSESGQTWSVKEPIQKFLSYTTIHRNDIESSLKLARSVSEGLCPELKCKCLNWPATCQHDSYQRDWALYYFFAAMITNQKDSSHEQREAEREIVSEATGLFPLPFLVGEGADEAFDHGSVNWDLLELDPTLTHQLKVALNPKTIRRPTLESFTKGPALMSTENKVELLKEFVDQAKVMQRDRRSTAKERKERKNAEVLDFLERDHSLVTGNNFTLLRHPIMNETVSERYPDAFAAIAVDPLTRHSTLALARFVQRAVNDYQCDLGWFLQLSPNLWPVIMRTILKYPNLFQLHKLKREYFIYWTGKFNDIELSCLEPVAEPVVGKEGEEPTPMQRKAQLRTLMGGLEQSIQGMREACEDGHNRHKPVANQINKLKYGLTKVEERLGQGDAGATLETVRQALRLRIRSLEDSACEEDMEMYENAEYLGGVLKECLKRFKSSAKRSAPSKTSRWQRLKGNLKEVTQRMSREEGDRPLDSEDSSANANQETGFSTSDITLVLHFLLHAERPYLRFDSNPVDPPIRRSQSASHLIHK